MLKKHQTARWMAEDLRSIRDRLSDLIPQFHEAAEQCIRAAKPLAILDELNLEQRRQLAKSIIAANREWEEVDLQIQKTLSHAGFEAPAD